MHDHQVNFVIRLMMGIALIPYNCFPQALKTIRERIRQVKDRNGRRNLKKMYQEYLVGYWMKRHGPQRLVWKISNQFYTNIAPKKK